MFIMKNNSNSQAIIEKKEREVVIKNLKVRTKSPKNFEKDLHKLLRSFCNNKIQLDLEIH